MKKRICLITPGHLASNPRLVKEATALQQTGLDIHIIFSQYVRYLIGHDQRILESNPAWTYEFLDWTGSSLGSRMIRYCSAVMQKLTNRPESKINRNFRWQLKKAVRCRADLYIGHNLAALPVAVLAAKKNGVKSGFDAEDFHRHQITDDMNDERVKLAIRIEKKYIPQLDYLTAAGDAIAEKYRALFKMDVLSICNVFPKRIQTVIPKHTTSPLKIFWFSQMIGPRRGLEEAILGIGLSEARIELHLLGEIRPPYKDSLHHMVVTHAGNCSLHFHPTMFPDDIFQFGEQFDIGLASEPGFSMNNKLALSNKLYTYLQCGLALAVSHTIAQTNFMKQFPQAGNLYKTRAELADILRRYDADRDLLFETRKASAELGQRTLNWENESQKFVKMIQSVLNLE